mmetsp:Transcript_42291/g.76666  ORF Transcript_42291/g.76666 Transcript_42291/m.76666 type:complete len:891 (-) Transcript_42291:222-2894(-)
MSWQIVALAASLGACGATNLNGKYLVSSGTRERVNFEDNYAERGHEYFDIWSEEIATRYGESYWHDQGTLPLPSHIVKRFAGKVIAITGYEHDQVMVQPQGRPGMFPRRDASVPISWAYNHHYQFWILGNSTDLRQVPASRQDPMAHGAPFKWVPVERALSTRSFPDVPSSQYFSEGNGGESRKSFHGYPSGFAQLVESPSTWHITPMQVDTANRDCGVRREDIARCRHFKAGPEPRSARFGRSRQSLNANYSGLLECPCTDRFGGDPLFYPDAKTRIFNPKFDPVETGSCPSKSEVQNSTACFEAAKLLNLGSDFIQKVVHETSLPPACSSNKLANGTVQVFFNTAIGQGECKGGITRTGAGKSKVGVEISIRVSAKHFDRSDPGKFCNSKDEHILQEFHMSSDSVAAALGARDSCEAWCLETDACWGCSVDCRDVPTAYGVPVKSCQWNAISACGDLTDWSGSITGDVSKKSNSDGLAEITMSGPADAWFGAGFDATLMANMPYTLIVNADGVIEQKIGTCGDEADHCPGTRLKSSITVVSNTVENNRRTVVLTRGLKGATPQHYSFSPTASGDKPIPFITAVGYSQEFAHHKAHGPTLVTLTPTGGSVCLCDDGMHGALCHTGGKDCKQFDKGCVAGADLDALHNSVCSSTSYLGGLVCCYDGALLLDTDQEPPEDLLRYHIKYRIWFQEYSPAPSAGNRPSHYNLDRIYYQTEAWAGEYDVPPAFPHQGEVLPGFSHLRPGAMTPGTTCTGSCPDGPDCECENTLTFRWTVPEMTLLYAGGHCHAPACISIELIREDTNQTICYQRTSYGKGDISDKWDEAGYITLPPCLWGSSKEDLDPPAYLPNGTTLLSIKRNRNTEIGHYGEMASWQMRGVSFQLPGSDFLV